MAIISRTQTKGGVITQEAGWQWVFFLNVPIAAVVVVVAIELRTRVPLVRMGLFRTATVAGANAVAFLFTGAFFATIFLMTLYTQKALGYSAIKTGLAYLPLTGGLIVFSTIAARLVTLCGVKLVLLTGMAATGGGLLVLAQATATSSFAGTLLPGFLLAATGIGGAMVALSIAAFAGVEDADFGAASGIFNTSQQIGGVVGVAVLSTVAYSHIHGASPAELHDRLPTLLGTAYSDAFGVGLVFVAAALVIAIVAIRQHEVSSWRCGTPYRVSKPTAAPALAGDA